MTARVTLDGVHIKPEASARSLGIIMDPQLTGKPHLQDIQAKATDEIAALRSVGNSAWGHDLDSIRTLYRSVILPSMLFCCSAWYTPGATDYKMKKDQILKVLKNVQMRAAIAIFGGIQPDCGRDSGCTVLSSTHRAGTGTSTGRRNPTARVECQLQDHERAATRLEEPTATSPSR